MASSLTLLILGMVVVLIGILVCRLPAFLALIGAAWLTAALTPTSALTQYAQAQTWHTDEVAAFTQYSAIKRVIIELSETFGKVGLIIAMASVIGKCLLSSGAADRIVRSSLKVIGLKRAPWAMTGSGFLLGIPVFFDTLFYLMIPLAKSLGLRDRSQYGRLVMSIIAGGTMAHSLIPPTPGPLLVASQLQVPMGWMIGGGLVVGLFTCWVGQLYARWANRQWPLKLRDSGGISLKELEDQINTPTSELPALWLSLFPILLPVVLITIQSILSSWQDTSFHEASLSSSLPWRILMAAGEKNTALILAAIAAIALLYRYPGQDGKPMRQSLEEALSQGGLILLITSAGGAFGGILQHTGIAEAMGSWASSYQLGLLPLAFGLTALVRTAQGSATVAMITAVGVFAGMGNTASIGFHPLYLALAIGCGSKPFPWMNDSGFWVIGRMSGMEEGETFRYFSFMISLMGLAGLGLIMVLAKLFPLV